MKLCKGNGSSQAPHMAPVAEFSSDRTRPDKLCVYCRQCAADRQRAWKGAHRDKVRNAKRAYRAKLKAQA